MEPQRIRTFVIDYTPLVINKTSGKVSPIKPVVKNITKPVVAKNITGGAFKQKQ